MKPNLKHTACFSGNITEVKHNFFFNRKESEFFFLIRYRSPAVKRCCESSGSGLKDRCRRQDLMAQWQTIPFYLQYNAGFMIFFYSLTQCRCSHEHARAETCTLRAIFKLEHFGVLHFFEAAFRTANIAPGGYIATLLNACLFRC